MCSSVKPSHKWVKIQSVCCVCVYNCWTVLQRVKVVLVEKINGNQNKKWLAFSRWQRKNLQTANILDHLLFPPMEVSARKRMAHFESKNFIDYTVLHPQKSRIANNFPTCLSRCDSGRTGWRSFSNVVAGRHQKFIFRVRTKSSHRVVQSVNAVDGFQRVLGASGSVLDVVVADVVPLRVRPRQSYGSGSHVGNSHVDRRPRQSWI